LGVGSWKLGDGRSPAVFFKDSRAWKMRFEKVFFSTGFYGNESDLA